PVPTTPPTGTSPVPTAPPTTTSTPKPPIDEGHGIPWIGWAATGALAAGAAITGVMALGASSELESQRQEVGVSRDTLDDQSSKVGTLALVSDILTGCAVVAGGVSLYFTITAGPSTPSDAKESTTPAAGLQKVRFGLVPGGVNLSGQF
ncbi:MAG: hypothetical protein HUU21_28320, partial [Polyangiaceae bacterium]|nr:hypothetical protein [Polyangiaceae bacterium]